jgi:antitoxin MazE
MRIAIRRIGNSKGIIIPTAMLQELGLDAEAEISIEHGALVVRAPSDSIRAGWAKASQELAKYGDDELILPEFGNADDEELRW